MAWLLDLDGVVWLDDEPVPGAANAVARLRESGQRVVFLTNNSSLPVGDYVAKLRRFGIAAIEADVITSAQAAASLLAPNSTAVVCGGRGVDEALQRRGVRTVMQGRADAVVVGFHQEFDYKRLTAAFRSVRAGARLIGTNDDPTYPTPAGPVPGAGAILASVAYAAGVQPELAGKPHDPIVRLVSERVGLVHTMVGDRPSTDGLLARRLGARFALVLSGVTEERDLPVDPSPDVVTTTLATLVEQELGQPTGS